MLTPFAVGEYLVVPYRPFAGDLGKNDRILEECVAHPERFTLPMTRDDIRVTAAAYLTDPNNLVWEVWRGASLSGIFLLGRVVPKVDALWHFIFFDGLLGKQALLEAFIERAFTDLQLQRLSLEIPESETNKLVRFARRKLGFLYEGEGRVSAHSARNGSRRERAYFDGETWRDILLLRRLRNHAS